MLAVVLARAGAAISLDVERRLLDEAGVELSLLASDARLADVVLNFSEPLTAADLASLERCRGIVCFSTGLDHVDLEAAAALGIPVRNVPDYASDEVAEHALALLLALARKVLPLHRAAASGDWSWRPVAGAVHTIAGQTLGLIGLGRIGSRLASRARGIGMRTVAYDPFVAEADTQLTSLAELLAASDFISVHAPLTPATHHLVDGEVLRRMKPGAFLINTARGGLVDEEALLVALREGQLNGAALDVREQEPPPQPDRLATLPNVILTPHVGAFSVQAAERLHVHGTRLAIDLLRGAPERAT